MPIKFRCQHCRQFLGISRSKAGTVVDCPACGRSIRVPQLDGRIEPIPDPELNLDDSELVQALDELASISAQPVDSSEAAVTAQAAGSQPQPVSVAPEPEPIDVAPLAPAQVVASPIEAHGSASRPSPSADAPSTTVDPVAALAKSSPVSPAAATASVSSSFGLSIRLIASGIALLAVVAGIVFWMGYQLGRRAPEMPLPAERNTSGQNQTPVARVPRAEVSREPAAAAIQGRITYKTESGESRPDRGARVIVFPETRSGDVKLSVVGFRPGDAPADFQVVVAALRALGGNAAIVDESGNYSIQLPKAGKYHILALSHYQASSQDGAVDPELTSILSEFFDGAPDQLLGHTQSHASPLRYSGGRSMTWDYSFESP